MKYHIMADGGELCDKCREEHKHLDTGPDDKQWHKIGEDSIGHPRCYKFTCDHCGQTHIFVTVDVLRSMGACAEGKEWFEQEYPNGLEVTKEWFQKMAERDEPFKSWARWLQKELRVRLFVRTYF